MQHTYRKYLDFLTETAFLAGKLTLAHFLSSPQPDFKSDLTPVTIADRQAEQFIRQRIETYYPHTAILGEEFGSSPTDGSSTRWIIDPIDGTKAFMRGVPLYAVLIGLEIDGEVKAGAAYFPGIDEMLAAADGEGCWWNGRRAHVSSVKDISKAYVLTTDWGGFIKYGRQKEWEQLSKAVFHRAGWSDAYAFNLIATGRSEIAIEPQMAIWDCGPFPPILREAGGYFGDWMGNATIYGNEALACSMELLPTVLPFLK